MEREIVPQIKGTGMVSRSLLKDATEILPKLSITDNFKEIREQIISSLKYNSEYSRKGISDTSLHTFSLRVPWTNLF